MYNSKQQSTNSTFQSSNRDTSMLDYIKRELRENQEMVQDLQSLLKLNKEAIKVNYDPDLGQKGMKLLENYKKENDM